MPRYAIWNNKGGVGKSYLTFQIACEYATQHPDRRVLVVDMCPQANASSMLLGGIVHGEQALLTLSGAAPLLTISGYIEDRIRSPYVNPHTGNGYVVQVSTYNRSVPPNVFLVVGDEQLEIQASRVVGATNPGPQDAWRIVHQWIGDLIGDVSTAWNAEFTTFLDCNPSFTIYTELALSASDHLIIPFTADGSSKRAVRTVLALLYGVSRTSGAQQSQYFLNSNLFRMTVPTIYTYVGNRLTQNLGPATAFGTVVAAIGTEIFQVWNTNPNRFAIHPNGSPPPRTKAEFKRMFQAEINDANTASVVSSALGMPMGSLGNGVYTLVGRDVKVNQSQLDKLQPNIRNFVQTIE